MFWKKKDNKNGILLAPQTGKVIEITQVPDPVFAGKLLGDGVALQPENGMILAPIDGSVINVAETLHAYGIQGSDGLVILIHIGINTVELKGTGFHPCVKVGDTVKAGDPLCEVDLIAIREAGYETWTPVLVTNMEDVVEITSHTGHSVMEKDTILSYKLK